MSTCADHSSVTECCIIAHNNIMETSGSDDDATNVKLVENGPESQQDENDGIASESNDSVLVNGNNAEGAEGGEMSPKPELVHSEILCYIQTYMQSCAPDNIKRIVQCFYSAEQIREAKQTLWDSKISNKLKKFQNRKSTPNRTETEANLNDIMEAVADLDKQNINSVKFVTIDLTQIPKHTPEEINQYAILDRIAALERKYDDLQGNCSRNYIMMTQQEKNIERIEENSASQETILREVQMAVKEKNDADTSIEGPEELDELGEQDDVDQDGDEEDQPAATAEPLADEVSVETAASTSGTASSSEAAVEVQEVEQGERIRPASTVNTTQTAPTRAAGQQRVMGVGRPTAAIHGANPVNRPQPQQSRFRGERNVQPGQRDMGRGPVRSDGRPTYAGMVSQHRDNRGGSGTNDGFQIPPYHRKRSNQQVKNRDLFITKINKQFTCDKLYEYLRCNGVMVKGLYQRSHMNSSYKSFVVTVQNNDVNKVKNGKLWDDGIQIRDYIPKV